ncbi:protoporphyrinogen/coproporphyrinogen oxidase [Streptomyces sp. NPDC012600]|uniref:NAD(P)/FAD-dependent oxidoreductase n=3 Tax=Streptomyces TaxID=1883 RepID=A0ABU2W7Y3_9ACTN|nr:NAD(P)/FAD-dependent oxidoreductase [Streptomyces griseus]MDT0493956.1 NAD(P)/FAD-dependent oxidoreductase [Streptomyces griseus]
METRRPTAIVVGAGIAGLTAAWRLRQAGLRVRVLERGPAAGGRMRTVEHDGFRVELGASILGRNYTGMLGLIEELGLSQQFGPSSTLCGFGRDDTVHRLRTDSRADLLRTRLVGLRTKAAVFRALPNFLAHRRRLDWDTMDRNTYLDTLSATQYARRHLTREAIDHLCEPLFGGGIVLASPDRMAAADMLFYTAKLLVPHFNSPQGVGLLTRTLADRLPVELNSPVTSVRRDADGLSVTWRDGKEGGGGAGEEHTERADAVVVAVPAPQVPGILPDLSAPDRDYLSSVPYSRALIVSLGLERPPPERAFALFLARRTHPALVGVELHHNKIPGRVDDGRGLITLHPRQEFTDLWWDADDTTVTEQAVTAAGAVFPGLRETVLTSHVSRQDPALVVRPPGGYADLRAFNARRRAADPRLQLAGDYFGPSSTYGALRSGEQAAARLLSHLAPGRRGT